jgi:hypothetical protein
MPASNNRKKISTTVSPDTHRYLEQLVSQGRARNLAEAVDVSVARARREDNRARLERETAAYFNGLLPRELREENELAGVLSDHSGEVEFDD